MTTKALQYHLSQMRAHRPSHSKLLMAGHETGLEGWVSEG
jgi:hypothetical protein